MQRWRIRRTRRGLTILGRFVVLYVVVLAIPLLVGSLALWRGLGQLREDLLETNLRVLRLNQQLFTAELDRVREQAIRIDLTPELRRLYTRDGPVRGPLPVWLLDAWGEAFDHVLLDAVLHEVIVYASGLHVVFTSGDIYLRPEIFAENFFFYDDMSPGELQEFLFEPTPVPDLLPAATLRYRQQEIPVVIQRYGLPLDDPLRAEASLIAVLNAEELQDRLSALTAGGSGYAAVLSRSGQVIVSVGPDEFTMPQIYERMTRTEGSFEVTVDGSSYTAAYVRDSRLSIAHVVLVPTRIYLQQAFRLQLVAVIAALVAIVVGVIVSGLFAYRTSRPIVKLDDLLHRVEDAERDRTPVFDFLSSRVERLISRNSELRTAVEAQRPLAAMAAGERLMRGEYLDEERARQALEEVGVTEFGASYCCLLVVVHHRREGADLAARKVLIRAALADQVSSWPVLDRGDDELVVVGVSQRSGGQEAHRDFWDLAEEVVHSLEGSYRADTRVFLGEVVHAMTDLPASLLSAQIARAHSIVSDTVRVHSANDLPGTTDRLSYPIRVESQLIAATVAGDTERVDGLLDALLAENLGHRALTEQDVHLLFSEVKGTAMRALEYLKDETRARELLALMEVPLGDTREETIRARSAELFHTVASSFEHQRGTHHAELKQRMERYVTEHLLDRNLSLAGMADYAGVSEAYASSMFKEIMGENFGAYVERERLELAQRLLVEEQYTVEQIASRVGYNSATSFRRAFKRRFGVPPSAGRGRTPQ